MKAGEGYVVILTCLQAAQELIPHDVFTIQTIQDARDQISRVTQSLKSESF